MLQLGLRTSLRLHSGVSVDIEALSRMRTAGPDEVGRCTGGTRGGLGIRGVLATGVLAYAHYSVGSGDCEPTHAAVTGVSFAFGGLPLRRIPTAEEVGAADFWQRVYLGIADPVLDCNGWMLDDKSLVPLFKFGEPDPVDPTLIRSHGESFRVGEHFDIDRQGRLYRANLLRQALFGGQRFTDASVSQKRELPVCEQGPRHRFAEHCQVMEKTIEKLADAARSDGGPGWTAAMGQQWEFERECLGGKDDEERGRQLSDILRIAQLIAKRGRSGSPAGVRGATPAGATSGFSSFSSFKRAMGPAGAGKEWHHIVEQTSGNIEKFGAEAVHNTSNVMRLDAEVHRRISGYYSSEDFNIHGDLTVRQWLSTQSFEAQTQFGLKAIKKYGENP
jgi:hypothetical protein